MRLTATVAGIASITLLAAACASGGDTATTDPTSDTSVPAAAEGRVAVSYEGGIAVLDAETLEVIAEFDSEEFTRLNPRGDGRSIAVTTSEGFQILDTAEPALTDLVFEGTTPGHVVIHEGNTALFDDGTGVTTIIPTDAFTTNGFDELPETTTYTADAPHHGVSIVLEDGTLVTTVGTSEGRADAEGYLLNAVALIDTAAQTSERDGGRDRLIAS